MKHTEKTGALTTPSVGFPPMSRDLETLIAVSRDGLSIWARDVPPERASEIGVQLARVEDALAPASPKLIASWLKKLGEYVSNPPGSPEAARASCAAISAVCEDLPKAVWSKEAHMAWCRQPARDGYPVGARWPSPSELYNLLSPMADKIRGERIALRRLKAIADERAEAAAEREEHSAPSAEEIEAVSAKMRAMREARRADETRQKVEEEQEEKERRSARDREHKERLARMKTHQELSAFVPPGAEGLRGDELADALEKALPEMNLDLFHVTVERIEMLRKSAHFLRQLGLMESGA